MARLTQKLSFVVDPSDAAELEARAEAGGHSVGHELRQAVKTHLSPEAYDSIAGVILEAAERIRQRKKDEDTAPGIGDRSVESDLTVAVPPTT